MGSIVNCPGCNQPINVTPQMMQHAIACPLCKSPLDCSANNATEVVVAELVPRDPRIPAPDDSPAPYQPPAEMLQAYRHYEQLDAAQAAPQPQGRSTLSILGLLGCGGLLLVSLVAIGLIFAVQGIGSSGSFGGTENLLDAREGFVTKLTSQQNDGQRAPDPPPILFSKVKYPSPLGPMTAYLSKPFEPGEKHPAVIWLIGGFSNGIGDTAWTQQPADNDQSASAFREQGIVMMFPSLRGGNDNPGYIEAFFGEVDDVLAAADFLAEQEFVDPNRIYLGGHSTGGTLALLCAASTDRFRAVFSLGPVDDVRGYGQDTLPFSVYNTREARYRNPINWLGAIKSPTFVFEGSEGNSPCIRTMKSRSRNGQLHFYLIDGEDHFSIIGPLTRMLADKVSDDTGAKCNISMDQNEL